MQSSNNIRAVTLTADGWGMLHAWEARLIHFVAGQLEEKDHLEVLGIDRSVVLKRILRNVVGGGVCVDWIHLAYVREQWHIL